MLSKIIVIAETTEGAIKVIQEMKKAHPEITSIEVRITQKSVATNDASKDRLTNLNISEAATLSSLKCMYMQRESLPEVKIEPTNSDWCCVISGIDGTHRTRGWEPNLDDLMAQDWRIVN
ncbi:MAG TPA: hypothetical protein DCP62_00080 [Erysipelotrichaceae bacterium]|nr:hypothetical protein [Erysipelotrichaceae bacterium]